MQGVGGGGKGGHFRQTEPMLRQEGTQHFGSEKYARGGWDLLLVEVYGRSPEGSSELIGDIELIEGNERKLKSGDSISNFAAKSANA